MRPITLTVNGRSVSAAVQPRTHLADFLREQLNLTGTHLRCEQGACGACTVLVDGQPARSCITYAALCHGAEVKTIEGLREDAVMLALHRAFSEEHGLQCGFCTPGMLVTARDIVLRLPDAGPDRVRLELSGNLCRCTGYVGIVRAICRVLGERRAGSLQTPERELGPIGPVGARAGADALERSAVAAPKADETRESVGILGLNGRKPTLELNSEFKLNRPAEEVWAFFADPARVVACLPGASLSRALGNDEFDGRMSIKLGPISANFAGRARIARDDKGRTGMIVGLGRDSGGGSLASGELRYSLKSAGEGATLVALNTRMLVAGPLAQFARSGIVDDIVNTLIGRFAANVETSLSGGRLVDSGDNDLRALALLRSLLLSRLRKLFGRT